MDNWTCSSLTPSTTANSRSASCRAQVGRGSQGEGHPLHPPCPRHEFGWAISGGCAAWRVRPVELGDEQRELKIELRKMAPHTAALCSSSAHPAAAPKGLMEVRGRKKAVEKVKRREKGGTRDWMSTGPTKPGAWRNNQCVDSSGVAAASLDPHSAPAQQPTLKPPSSGGEGGVERAHRDGWRRMGSGCGERDRRRREEDKKENTNGVTYILR